MLRKTKQLTMKSKAPMQKRVISALDIPSFAFSEGALFIPFQKLRNLTKNPCFSAGAFCWFLVVFLSDLGLFFVLLISYFDVFACKISGKNVKR